MAGNELAYLKVSELAAKTSFSDDDSLVMLDDTTGKVKSVASSYLGIQTGATKKIVYNATVTATLAEVNAGKTLIAGETGVTIRPLGVTVQCNGAFETGTAIVVQSTNDTPVVLTTLAQANLTDGAVLKDGETGSTRGVGVSANLTAGDGIEIDATGSDFITATSIDFDIQYTRTV